MCLVKKQEFILFNKNKQQHRQVELKTLACKKVPG
jgi:hypothetical protein